MNILHGKIKKESYRKKEVKLKRIIMLVVVLVIICNVNRNLTICDNRILITPEQS
jgi:hypothetical protein